MVKKGIGAAAVIFNADGDVLLVKQSYGKLNWELPGGGAEEHESPAETAEREVMEETGLNIDTLHMTGVYYQEHDDSIHFVFAGEVLGHNPPVRLDAEVTDIGYWPVEELPRPISDFTIVRIRDAISGQKQRLPAVVFERKWLD